MFAIRNKKTKDYFCYFDERDEKEIWGKDDPWLYERMVDALFVVATMKWENIVEIVEPTPLLQKKL